jgi:long-chain acyl-CoA synthetase
MAPLWGELDPEVDVNLGAAPLFHIAGLVVGLGGSLAVPMPLVLSGRFDAAETLRLIETHRVTFVLAAITAFTAMLGDPSFAMRDLSSLSKVASGGAPVPPAVVERWEEATGTYIHNGYGLTESTAGTHLTPRGRRSPIDPRSGVLSVGLPLPGTRVRVADASGGDAAPGGIGEVLLQCPQLARGYWRNPAETALAFSDGWLRTGDVGFVDDEGWLYLVDRKKDLIVASGYKVWPREVEDVLYEHPAVHECAVVGIADGYRGETVKAFVSAKPGTAVTTEELIAFSRERLAAYKYPRAVEILAELPKTPSGKILRRALRDGTATAETSTERDHDRQERT